MQLTSIQVDAGILFSNLMVIIEAELIIQSTF